MKKDQKKSLALAKQKLIFYLSYVKSHYEVMKLVIEEFEEFRSAYIEGKVKSKREQVVV